MKALIRSVAGLLVSLLALSAGGFALARLAPGELLVAYCGDRSE